MTEEGTGEAGPPEDRDTDRYSRSTDQYPPGTEEYSGSTDEYPASSKTSEPERDPDDEAGGRADEGGSAEPQPFWRRAGFDSFYDYLRDFEEEQARLARMFGERPRVGVLEVLEGRAEEPDLELPSDELRELDQPPARQRRTRQVSVKLKPYEHNLLKDAAGEYGVPPGTLARMFVVRGAQAIAERRRGEEERRQRHQQELRKRLG